MARSGVPTQISDDEIKPVLMIKAEFDSPVYLTTSQDDILWGTKLYKGEGSIISFDGVEESADLGAKGVTLGMALSSNNVTADLLQKVVSDDYQGSAITIYLRLQATYGINATFHGDPIVLFDGFVDIMTAEDDGEVAQITLTAESNLVRLGRVHNRRYTHEDQVQYFSNDLGLSHVTDVLEKQIYWGTAAEGE